MRQSVSVVFFRKGIDKKSAEQFISQLLAASLIAKTILIYLNSSGGDIDATLQICHEIKRLKKYNRIIVAGQKEVSSAAVMILATGHERLAISRTKLLYHLPVVQVQRFNKKFYNLFDIAKQQARLKEAEQIFYQILDLLLERLTEGARITPLELKEKIMKRQGRDLLIRPRKAKKLGLIDQIFPNWLTLKKYVYKKASTNA